MDVKEQALCLKRTSVSAQFDGSILQQSASPDIFFLSTSSYRTNIDKQQISDNSTRAY